MKAKKKKSAPGRKAVAPRKKKPAPKKKVAAPKRTTAARPPGAGEVPTMVLAADHRAALYETAQQKGLGEDAVREFKVLVAEAYLSARARSKLVQARGGLILDHDLGLEAIRIARRAGVPVGQPAELSGIQPLALYPNFESTVLAMRPSFIKCLVSGRPDDPPDAFEAQNATVHRLASACDRAGIPLVLELIVPRRPAEAEEHFEQASRPALTARWMNILGARGVSPAQWKLEGMATGAQVKQVAAQCHGGERIVVLGKSAPPQLLKVWFAAAKTHGKSAGFAVGRSIFWQPFLLHLGGAPADETVSAIRDAYLATIDLWERA